MTPATPHHLEQVIRTAQRRRQLQKAITSTSWSVAGTTLLALSLLGIDRNLSATIPAGLIMSVALLGFPLGMVLAWRKKLSPHAAASTLDESYHLKNRLASALSLPNTEIEPSANQTEISRTAFAELVNLDAQRTAASINIIKAFPISWTRLWSVNSILWGLLIAGILWLPNLQASWFEPGEADRVAAASAANDSAAQAIRAAAERLQQRRAELFKADDTTGTGAQTGSTAETDRVLQTLEDLSTQLARANTEEGELSADGSADKANLSPEQLVAEAAATLADLAEELAESAELERQQNDSILEHFSSLKNNAPDADDDTPNTAELQQLLESLQMGKSTEAAETVGELDRQLQQQTPAERRAFAEELRRLAEQLEHSPEAEATPLLEAPNENAPTTPEATRNPSIPPAEEQNQDVEQIAQRLEAEGFDAETARAVAEDLRAQERTRQAEEQATAQLRETAEQMRQWADDLEQPPAPTVNENTSTNKNNNPIADETPADTAVETKPRELIPPIGSDQPNQPDQPTPQDKSVPGDDPELPAKSTAGDDSGNQTRDPKTGDVNNGVKAEQPAEEAPAGGQPNGNQKTSAQNAATDPDAVDTNESTEPAAPPAENTGNQRAPRKSNAPADGERQPTEMETSQTESDSETTAQSAADSAEPPAGDQPTQQPATKNNDPQQTEPETGSEGARRVQEILKKIESLPERARQQEELSAEAKREAERLIEQMSPGERQELERWAAELNRAENDHENENTPANEATAPAPEPAGNEPPANGTTTTPGGPRQPLPYDYEIENLDARSDNPEDRSGVGNDRVLSEWSQAGQAATEGAGGEKSRRVSRQPGRELSPAEMARATQAIQRALDEEAIAPRYRELLKRWTAQLAKQKTVNTTPAKSVPKAQANNKP